LSKNRKQQTILKPLPSFCQIIKGQEKLKKQKQKNCKNINKKNSSYIFLFVFIIS
jgi:hypothetical protein